MNATRLPLVVALLLLPILAACGSDEPAPPAPANGAVTVELDGRPFRLYVPDSYRPDVPVPLVIGLHGYTSDSVEMESYFRIAAEASRRGFLYAMPDGTRNTRGDRFWNATERCCDFQGSGVDDSAYLRSLIKTVAASYAVDRVFLIGHSNGGFMAHRMACDHADQITAIASLAGLAFTDPARCTPSRPVSVLQIHGTADTVIPFGDPSTSGAETTVALWRERNGCADGPGTVAPAVDLDHAVAGPETVATTVDGCDGGSRVALWRMEGSGHVPVLTEAFTPMVIDFFYDSLGAA